MFDCLSFSDVTEDVRERLRNGLGSTIGNLVTIVMEREAEAREERDAASGEDENAAAASAASGAVEEDDHKSVSHEGDTNLLKYQKLPPLRLRHSCHVSAMQSVSNSQ